MKCCMAHTVCVMKIWFENNPRSFEVCVYYNNWWFFASNIVHFWPPHWGRCWLERSFHAEYAIRPVHCTWNWDSKKWDLKKGAWQKFLNIKNLNLCKWPNLFIIYMKYIKLGVHIFLSTFSRMWCQAIPTRSNQRYVKLPWHYFVVLMIM